VRRLQAGETTTTVQLTTDDEFSHLASVFHTMTGKLHAATQLMERETQQNDRLLLNIMPPAACARTTPERPRSWRSSRTPTFCMRNWMDIRS
jgi:hypothetical protein